jgi:hypothetical protein
MCCKNAGWTKLSIYQIEDAVMSELSPRACIIEMNELMTMENRWDTLL